MIRLYISSEPYLLDEMEKQFRQKISNNMNFKKVLTKPNIQELCDFVETYPIFDEFKLLVLKNTGVLDSDCEELFKACSDTTEILILEPEIDKRKKSYKWIQKNGIAEEIKLLSTSELEKWVTSISANPIDSKFLINYLGTNMYYLKNEIERINSFAEPNQQITAEWIQYLCKKNLEEKIFALADEISSHNLQTVMKYYETVLDQPPMRVLAMLKRHFQILINAKALINKSDKDIASGCGVAPFTVKKYKSQAKTYDDATLHEKLEIIANAEFSIKTSTNDRVVLEQTLIQLTL